MFVKNMTIVLRWWWWINLIFIFLIKFHSINCFDDLCNYLIYQSDQNIDICLSNQCNKYIDPQSIMVKPNNCKTNILYLSFSSYKIFRLFIKRIQWKLGILFSTKLNKKNRLLRIYLNSIDFDDKPTDDDQLKDLGNNIDLYELYIRNLTNNSRLNESIHYHPNDSQWFIIKIQFICKSMIIYNEKPCPANVIPPSYFAPQRPLLIKQIIPLVINSTIQSIYKQEDERSIHLIIIILIPLLIIIITILLSIFIYRKFFLKQSLRTSSIPSISSNINTNQRNDCEHERNTKPYQISRLPSPHEDSLYKERQRHI
ncbi:unnamed protein product [Adineta steineri]|uniref:Uncharacterized protein n=1 Tax=Adineta steineri TaxID=433720 RepID=A0A815C4G7_9BILA|nr:unnamed protein product [Adineta steineri]CAF1564895.1 unnamed protein product [Adineta steineri]